MHDIFTPLTLIGGPLVLLALAAIVSRNRPQPE